MTDMEQGIVGDPPNSNSTRSSSCGCFGRLLKRQFDLVNSKPKTILTEVWGGIVMYLVSLYVLGAGVGWQAGICPDCLENSSAISSAGYTAAEFRSLPGAISMAAGISTLVMGLFGNMPIIVAPGISGIAMQSVSKTIGPDGAQAAVMIVGLFVLLFVVASRRIKLISSLPEDYRLGMAAGKGGIIALIALRTSSLVSISSLGFTSGFTSTFNYNVILAVCGFILIIFAEARKYVTLAFVGEIVIITAVSLIIRGVTGTAIVSPEQAAIVDLGALAGAPSFANFSAENSFIVFSYVIRATIHTVIDIVATVTAIILSGVVRSSIGYDKTTFTAVLNESSKCYHLFLSIAICEVLVNPFLGVAPVTPFIQSTAGVMVGARTGLSATICGMLFLISTLFAAPIASVIPLCATGPVVFVACLPVVAGLKYIDFSKPTRTVPAFLAFFLMTFTDSIGVGFSLSFVILFAAFALSHERVYLSPQLVSIFLVCIILLLIETGLITTSEVLGAVLSSFVLCGTIVSFLIIYPLRKYFIKNSDMIGAAPKPKPPSFRNRISMAKPLRANIGGLRVLHRPHQRPKQPQQQQQQQQEAHRSSGQQPQQDEHLRSSSYHRSPVRTEPHVQQQQHQHQQRLASSAQMDSIEVA